MTSGIKTVGVLLLEIMHCARNPRISQSSASRQGTYLKKVALLFNINCKLLVSEKTDSEYNV